MGNAPSALPSAAKSAVAVKTWQRRALRGGAPGGSDLRSSRVAHESERGPIGDSEAARARNRAKTAPKHDGHDAEATWPGVDGGMGVAGRQQSHDSADAASDDASGATSTPLGGSLVARNSHNQLSWRSNTTRGESSMGESPSHLAATAASGESAESSLPGTPTHATRSDGTMTVSKPKVRGVMGAAGGGDGDDALALSRIGGGGLSRVSSRGSSRGTDSRSASRLSRASPSRHSRHSSRAASRTSSRASSRGDAGSRGNGLRLGAKAGEMLLTAEMAKEAEALLSDAAATSGDNASLAGSPTRTSLSVTGQRASIAVSVRRPSSDSDSDSDGDSGEGSGEDEDLVDYLTEAGDDDASVATGRSEVPPSPKAAASPISRHGSMSASRRSSRRALSIGMGGGDEAGRRRSTRRATVGKGTPHTPTAHGDGEADADAEDDSDDSNSDEDDGGGTVDDSVDGSVYSDIPKHWRHLSTLKVVFNSAGLPAPMQEQFLAKLRKTTFADGEYIVRQGQAENRFFVVTRGRAVATVRGPTDRTARVVNHLFEGHFIGELALLRAQVATTSVHAVGGPVSCMYMTRKTFQTFVDVKFKGVIMEMMLLRESHQAQVAGAAAAAAGAEPAKAKRLGVDGGRRDPVALRGRRTMVKESRLTRRATLTGLQGSGFGTKEVINEYVVLRTLGSGSYGHVNLVQSLLTRELFAIKTVDRGMLRKKSLWFYNHTEMDREIAVMKKLDHKNIVNLVEVIEDEAKDRIYLVQEYVENGALMPEDEYSEPVPTELARQYFRDLLKGLEYLHANNVIHRDLKPSNILVAKDGACKIGDFGVATFAEANGDTLTEVRGTPAFMAPELFNEGAYSGFASDVWAAGATLYNMVVGTPPFAGAKNEIELAARVQRDELRWNDTVERDPRLKNVLRGMLDKDPSSRATIKDLLEHPWVTNNGANPLPATEYRSITLADHEVETALEDSKKRRAEAKKQLQTMLRAKLSGMPVRAARGGSGAGDAHLQWLRRNTRTGAREGDLAGPQFQRSALRQVPYGGAGATDGPGAGGDDDQARRASTLSDRLGLHRNRTSSLRIDMAAGSIFTDLEPIPATPQAADRSKDLSGSVFTFGSHGSDTHSRSQSSAVHAGGAAHPLSDTESLAPSSSDGPSRAGSMAGSKAPSRVASTLSHHSKSVSDSRTPSRVPSKSTVASGGDSRKLTASASQHSRTAASSISGARDGVGLGSGLDLGGAAESGSRGGAGDDDAASGADDYTEALPVSFAPDTNLLAATAHAGDLRVPEKVDGGALDVERALEPERPLSAPPTLEESDAPTLSQALGLTATDVGYDDDIEWMMLIEAAMQEQWDDMDGSSQAPSERGVSDSESSEPSDDDDDDDDEDDNDDEGVGDGGAAAGRGQEGALTSGVATAQAATAAAATAPAAAPTSSTVDAPAGEGPTAALGSSPSPGGPDEPIAASAAQARIEGRRSTLGRTASGGVLLPSGKKLLVDTSTPSGSEVPFGNSPPRALDGIGASSTSVRTTGVDSIAVSVQSSVTSAGTPRNALAKPPPFNRVGTGGSSKPAQSSPLSRATAPHETTASPLGGGGRVSASLKSTGSSSRLLLQTSTGAQGASSSPVIPEGAGSPGRGRPPGRPPMMGQLGKSVSERSVRKQSSIRRGLGEKVGEELEMGMVPRKSDPRIARLKGAHVSDAGSEDSGNESRGSTGAASSVRSAASSDSGDAKTSTPNSGAGHARHPFHLSRMGRSKTEVLQLGAKPAVVPTPASLAADSEALSNSLASSALISQLRQSKDNPAEVAAALMQAASRGGRAVSVRQLAAVAASAGVSSPSGRKLSRRAIAAVTEKRSGSVSGASGRRRHSAGARDALRGSVGNIQPAQMALLPGRGSALRDVEGSPKSSASRSSGIRSGARSPASSSSVAGASPKRSGASEDPPAGPAEIAHGAGAGTTAGPAKPPLEAADSTSSLVVSVPGGGQLQLNRHGLVPEGAQHSGPKQLERAVPEPNVRTMDVVVDEGNASAGSRSRASSRARRGSNISRPDSIAEEDDAHVRDELGSDGDSDGGSAHSVNTNAGGDDDGDDSDAYSDAVSEAHDIYAGGSRGSSRATSRAGSRTGSRAGSRASSRAGARPADLRERPFARAAARNDQLGVAVGEAGGASPSLLRSADKGPTGGGLSRRPGSVSPGTSFRQNSAATAGSRRSPHEDRASPVQRASRLKKVSVSSMGTTATDTSMDSSDIGGLRAFGSDADDGADSDLGHELDALCEPARLEDTPLSETQEKAWALTRRVLTVSDPAAVAATATAGGGRPPRGTPSTGGESGASVLAALGPGASIAAVRARSNAKLNVLCGMHEAQGKRDSMEDRIILVPDLCGLAAENPAGSRGAGGEVEEEVGDGSASLPVLMAAVLDGHDGDHTAIAMQKTLPLAVRNDSAFPDDMEAALRCSFVKADNEYCEQAVKDKINCGCTAIMVVVAPSSGALASLPSAHSMSSDGRLSAVPASGKRSLASSKAGSMTHLTPTAHPAGGAGASSLSVLDAGLTGAGSGASDGSGAGVPLSLYCANAGDSRAVLCRGGDAIDLSAEHRATQPEERARIEAAGSFVANGRLHGVLAVSRAMGDVEHKQLKHMWEREFVCDPLIAEPEVRVEEICEDDEFVIIASDGVWDVMGSGQAVQFVRRRLLDTRDAQLATQDLVAEALSLGSGDNVSAVILCLNQLKLREAVGGD